MNRFENYNPIVLPSYRYATFPCKQIFNNENFDNVLKAIGNFYFHKPEAGLNAICTLIRDEINKEWRLNSLKKRVRLKRVSTTQIKTIRRAFIKISNDEEKYVRIPFDVVSIIFFIISLLNRIENQEDSIQNIFAEMDKTCISDYLYKEHTLLFQKNYMKRRNQITDIELQKKYDLLNANLLGRYSIMRCKYFEVDWDNNSLYIIK